MAEITEEQFKYIIRSRAYIRGEITKFSQKYAQEAPTYNSQQCIDALKKLSDLSLKIEKANDKVAEGAWQHLDDEQSDDEFQKIARYDSEILAQKCLLETRMQSIAAASNPPIGVSGQQSQQPTPVVRLPNTLKLPQVPLPKYCYEDGDDLESFFEEFESIVNKYTTDENEKFSLMSEQLKGEAKSLAKSLRGVQRSFTDAKQLLMDAFASEMRRKEDIINRLVGIKLNKTGEIYSFISEYRVIVKTFDRLKIDSADVIRFFLWNAMPKGLQTQFVHICNSNTPSLDEIDNNLFEAAKRFNSMRRTEDKSKSFKAENTHREQETTGLAAAVTPNNTVKPKFCNLCANDGKSKDHPIYKCPVYISAKEKHEKLKSMKACLRCGFTNHTTTECRFNFKKMCSNCTGKHFTYFCPKPPDNSQNKTHENKPIHSGTITVDFEAMLARNSSNVILPTFSCTTGGQTLRCLKDSGCQTTFIKQSVADKNKFEITQNKVSITIRGFNGAKEYSSNVVKLEIDIGKSKEKIEAVCIPEIPTHLVLPRLPLVVKGFMSKGYTLADEYLCDTSRDIKDLDMILGSNYMSCLPESAIKFGNSVCYDSSLGILLCGSTARILQDLENLPMVATHNNLADVKPEGLLLSDDVASHSSLLDMATYNDALILATNPSGDVENGDVSNILQQPYDNLDSDAAETAESKTIFNRGLSSNPESNHNSNIRSEEPDLISDSSCINPVTGPNRMPITAVQASVETNTDAVAGLPIAPGGTVGCYLATGDDYSTIDGIPNSDSILSDDILNAECKNVLNYDNYKPEPAINEDLVDFTLNHTSRDDTGRLIMPILWDGRNNHLLSRNFNLSKKILQSNFNKSKNSPEKLRLIDEVFKDQIEQGIIEKIPDLESFLQDHPEASFLPHMAVLKPEKETTKVRVVYMSNLASPDPCKTGSLSHNQTIQTGPTLNKKISTALLQLRFNEYILCYDLVKAFLQLKLTPEDSNKLCFLWFRNIAKEDYTVVGYRITRVPFGLRCSPALLMIGLYKILMVDSINDSNDLRDIKRSLYNLLYMDNGAISSNTTKDLEELYGKVKDVFAPYQFKLQQFITNSKHLQDIIDDDFVSDTPVINKVLGVEWNRTHDTLNPPKYSLNIDAQTKRQVLQSIASNYDTNNLNAPMLNRARLFLHQLQCRPDLTWDSKISKDQQREWRNISRQVNASQPIAIDRCIGRRDDLYDLIACVDSSKQIYGAVIYAHNLRTNKMSLICAKNRILNSKMESSY